MLIGIGATKELNLRVSVATLARVLFEHPGDGELMLALERKATLLDGEGGPFVGVKAQPFGGAIQLPDPIALQNLIGDFHFDSEQSRSEQDFRIFIQPSAWETVREFCLHHFDQANNLVLESDPRRELVEEFAEALEISLKPDQFIYKLVRTVIENAPSPTDNVYARGSLTVRVYRIFEARILDLSLARTMLTNSGSYSNEDLQQLAFKDYQNGGPGWANAVLALPLKQISAFYLAASPEARNRPLSFQNYLLDETVAVVLDGIPVPKYRRL